MTITVDWDVKQQNKQTNRCVEERNDDTTHRGSYMSAHVLLNLLNELEKRDKM